MKISENIDVSFGAVLCDDVDLLLESLLEARHDCGATSQDDIIVKVNLKIRITFVDRLSSHLMETKGFSIVR